jgi:hypothetical protein
MKSLRNSLKAPLAATLGLGLAIAAGSASASITWGPNATLFEDDDVDFHFDSQGNLKTNGLLEVGDVLSAVLELEKSAGVFIAPQELTGVAIVQLVARVDSNGDGTLDLDVFAPPVLGYDFYSGGPALAGGAGLAGAGGMVGFWLDNTPDLAIDAGNVVQGTPSCTTYAGCVAQATDGTQWLVAGFTGDADESWTVAGAPSDVSGVPSGNPVSEFGALNTGLGVLYNGTGRIIIDSGLSCAPFCGPGGDGKVTILAAGSIKGGGRDFVPNAEWFATSDFDMTLRSTVPVPGTVMLFGLGLLGLTTAARRKKA